MLYRLEFLPQLYLALPDFLLRNIGQPLQVIIRHILELLLASQQTIHDVALFKS